MRIFIAGASGAIGKPLIRELLGRGHQVFGVTRSRDKAHEIEELGASAIIADVLNKASILNEIERAAPEVIVDMLTSLPKEYTPQAMKEASELNNKIRIEGGSYLLEGAIKWGVRRYILQSSAFWYENGEGLATEDTPFALNATPGISAGTKIYDDLEKRLLKIQEIEGTVLRFGFFYGPGTWFEKGSSMANQIMKGSYPITGEGQGVWNFIHIEDAARAIALSLNSTPGIYNIVDDTPLSLSKWLPAYANFLNAPPPKKISIEEANASQGPDFVYYATKLRGASNAKAKRELDFQPRSLEWIFQKIKK